MLVLTQISQYIANYLALLLYFYMKCSEYSGGKIKNSRSKSGKEGCLRVSEKVLIFYEEGSILCKKIK